MKTTSDIPGPPWRPALAALALLACLAPAAHGQPKFTGDGGARPIPLINADEEMGGFVKKAAELIDKQDYVGAIDILQALLDRAEQCFVPTEDPRRYVPLSAKANEVIGEMPEAGMTLYRRQFDVQAERLYAHAAEALDEGELRSLVRRHLHTSFGDKALNLLASILFDRGEFSQAALCWKDIVARYKDTTLDRATLLAKISVAHHFAGESRSAQEAFEQLNSKYDSARASLGGQTVSVTAFVSRLLASEPPRGATTRPVQEGWSSMAGAPDSLAVMSPCMPVGSPRWTSPAVRIEDNPNIKALLLNLGPMQPYYDGSYRPPTPVLIEGQVCLLGQGPNAPRSGGVPAPCFIHPIVAGNLVLYRGADGIVAHDIITGEEFWKTHPFPLFRTDTNTRNVGYYNPYGNQLQDLGRCTLSLAEGKFYAVGIFLPLNANYARMMMGPGVKQSADTSVLKAFSLPGEGRLLWRVGDGEGSSDLLKGGKFLSAPTCWAGKLYVLMQYAQAYHLVCLDGETGRQLWSTMVSQMPILSYEYGWVPRPEQGSPPAVADGRVIVVTNAGVIAAFEADAGKALWAYQYDSSDYSSGMSRRASYSPRQPGTKGFAANPIVVSRGRAVCLPADGKSVLALRADSGELLWSADRQEQSNLAGIDDERVVLTEDKLIVLETATGKELWPGGRAGVGRIVGRPAVTAEAALASGRGEFVRLALADYQLSSIQLSENSNTALLGNLVCVSGKLVAANAAGVSVYSRFEEARDELTARLNEATPEKLPGLLYQRGMNAFNAGRADEALPDLLKARQLAADAQDTGLAARADQGLYRTYVSLGDAADDAAVMLDYFNKAQAAAYSVTSRGEMVIRMMKYQRRMGQPKAAAQLAQQLVTDFAATELTDVDIGDKADKYVRDKPDTPRFKGLELAHRHIKELIKDHGQDCYAAFDAKADAELKQALAADKPEAMVAVTDTYRHSVWAATALLRAAESNYRRAMKTEEANRRQPLYEAGLYLGRIIQDYPTDALVGSARLGRVVIYQQLKHPAMVERNLRNLEGLGPEVKLVFADVTGARDELVKRFSTQRRALGPLRELPPDDLLAPLARLYAGSEPALILRDAEGMPLHVNGCLFLLAGAKLTMFDPSSATYNDGIKWEATLPINPTTTYQYGFAGHAFSLIGALSRDGNMVAVCCRGGLAGVDVKTGKIKWQKQDNALTGNLYSMAAGEDQFVILGNTGQITARSLAKGEEAWRSQIPQAQLQLRGPPQVNGGLLLVPHGRTESDATLFDMTTTKTLGTIKMKQAQGPQFVLTEDGLVVGCDQQTLRLVEPVLGIDEPIWSVKLAQNLQPSLLAVGESLVAVAPNMNDRTVDIRATDGEGGIRRTVQLGTMNNRPALPSSAFFAGNRLLVLGGSQPNYNRLSNPGVRIPYCIDPSLHAFDLSTGKLLWQADVTTMMGQQLIVPVWSTRRYALALVKETAITRPSVLILVDLETGKLTQKIELPAVQNLPQPAGYFQHMAMSWPVAIGQRLVVETLKGIEVYGNKENPASAPSK